MERNRNNQNRVCTCRPPYNTPTTDKNGFNPDVYLHWSVITALLLATAPVMDLVQPRDRRPARDGPPVTSSGSTCPAVRLATRRDTNTLLPSSSRQQLATTRHTSARNVTAAPFHGSAPHSALIGCGRSRDPDQPISAECVDLEGDAPFDVITFTKRLFLSIKIVLR